MASPVKKSFDAKSATGLVLVVALGGTVGALGAGLLSQNSSAQAATAQPIQTVGEFDYAQATPQPSRDSWVQTQPQPRSFGFSRGS